MMEALRQWLAGVVACAFAVSLALELAPDGALRRIVQLTGALVLLLALLRPLGEAELPDAALTFSALSEERAALTAQYEQESRAALAAVIAERTGAYIEDKARALGLAVRAEVTVEEREGVPLPVYAVLYGTEDETLGAWVTRELRLSWEWRAEA